MRRTVALFVAVAALLAPKATRAQAISAGFGGNASGLVGQPVDVPVIVDMTGRPDRLGAFALTIRWRSGVLQFQQGLGGNFGSVTANTDSAVYGIIHLTGANPAGVGGLVTLGIGRFVPLTADTTSLVLSFSQLYAAGTFADLRPSLTVNSGEYCSAVGRYGDVNGDGLVNSADALIALTNAVGLPTGAYPIALGDVDSSGVTDTRDALIMLSDAVGIDVSAFPRVGRMLGGACATGIPVTIAIAPAVVSGVLVGQEVSFEARATGPTGALMSLPNAVFRSSDPTVLAFQGSPSVATALAPGTVTVTALRDAKDSAQTTVTVVARRTTHWVDAKAASASNQLGTQTLPFATIGAALAVARAGDTIRPQPGRYEETVVADSAVVLLGDTLADGTRPVIAGTATGILLAGAGASEVQYLELDGLADGIDIEGPSHVLLRGVWAKGVAYGVISDGGPIGQLRVESSRLVGSGVNESGSGLQIYSLLDTLVVQGTEISDFAGDGVYADEVLGVVVHGSRIHDLGGYGVYASAEAPVTFAMDSTAVINTYSWSVSLGGIQSAAFSHNQFINTPLNGTYGGYTTGVLATGSDGTGWLRFEGDSINQTGSDPEWLDVSGVDSVRIDSVWAQIPNGYGYVYDTPLVRVTNSQFVDLSGLALEVYFNSLPGGRVAIDNVSATGDPGCDQCATAFSLTSAATTVNNFTGSNLSEGLATTGDSSLTVTGSTFTHVYSPVSWMVTDTGTAAQLTVRNSQFIGFEDAIVTANGAVVVDSNTFQSSQDYAIEVTYPQATAQIVGNTITDVTNAIDFLADTRPVAGTISGNVITGLSGTGIQAEGGADSLDVTLQIVSNSVSCNATGSGDGYAIEQYYAHSVIRGNQVTGCWSGITATANSASDAVPRRDSILGNTVTVPGPSYAGIYVSGAVQARIGGNVVTADTTGYSDYGDIYVTGDSTSGGLVTARADSNQVMGGSYYGIFVSNVDSAAVLQNTVQGVSKADCAGCEEGGITVAGPVRDSAFIFGNLVRQSGTGISAGNSEPVTVVVDSNLVSGNVIGMSLGQYPGVGPVHVTRNRITGSAAPSGGGYGVYFYYADPELTLVDSNNIAGNQFGAYSGDGNTYQMPNNWWGDTAGPTCSPQYEACLNSVVGDSVGAGLAYSWQPQLSAPMPSGLPLNVPPARFASRVRAIMTRPASSALLTAPVARGAARRTFVPGVPPEHRLSPLRVPPGLKGAQAGAVQRGLSKRAAAMAAQRQRMVAASEVVATSLKARADRLAALKQVIAQRDSARAAQVAARVAAQQALHARRP